MSSSKPVSSSTDVAALYALVNSQTQQIETLSKQLTDVIEKVNVFMKELKSRPDFSQYCMYNCEYCPEPRQLIPAKCTTIHSDLFNKTMKIKCPFCGLASKTGVNYSGYEKDEPAAKENLVAELVSKKILTMPEQETKVNQK